MFRLMIGSDQTLTFPETGEGVTAVTDEVDTKTLSTKKSVLIVGQPHPSGFACHLPRSRGRSRFKCYLAYIHTVRLNRSPLFLLMRQAQMKKLSKKKMPEKEFRSCGSDKGDAPLTAQPFEKGGRKLSNSVTLTPIN